MSPRAEGQVLPARDVLAGLAAYLPGLSPAPDAPRPRDRTCPGDVDDAGGGRRSLAWSHLIFVESSAWDVLARADASRAAG